MKKKLSLIFSIFTVFVFAQMPRKDFGENNIEQKLSPGSYEKIISERQKMARTNTVENLAQLDERFDFNFAEKQNLDSKLENLTEKKNIIENKIDKSKSEEERKSFKEKLAKINADIEKIEIKLATNQENLEQLQKLYRDLKK